MQVSDDKPYDEINITPMLDLAYVLLVIFILMTTATVQGIKASLPRGSNAPPPKTKNENKLKTVSVDDSGKIYLDREELTLEGLEARLKVAKAANPKLPVVIKGDSGTQYQAITGVLGVVVKLDIAQVGLITKTR